MKDHVGGRLNGWRKLLLETAGVIALAFPVSAQSLKPDSCPVTTPNGIVAGSSERNERSYGNKLLSVGPFGLWPNGTVVFKPGGAGFQTQEGALGMKFGWMRGIRGKLRVSGRRIDADAPPLRFDTGTPNSDSGFLASYLIFSTPGCWEVTAQIDDREDSKITFVTRVEKIGDGPAGPAPERSPGQRIALEPRTLDRPRAQAGSA